MATSGIDRKLKIWDLRMYKEVQCCGIGIGAGSLSFSQRGLPAAGLGNIVEVSNTLCSQTDILTYNLQNSLKSLNV